MNASNYVTDLKEFNKLNNSTIATNARQLVNRAVEAGTLAPVSECACVFCGNGAHVYHHHSYAPDDWLNVDPLCGSCHKLLHLYGLAEFLERKIERCRQQIKADKRALARPIDPRWAEVLVKTIAMFEDDIECVEWAWRD